jgi:sporulation-control protein spo0M
MHKNKADCMQKAVSLVFVLVGVASQTCQQAQSAGRQPSQAFPLLKTRQSASKSIDQSLSIHSDFPVDIGHISIRTGIDTAPAIEAFAFKTRFIYRKSSLG